VSRRAVQRPADLPELLGVPLSPEQLQAACADAEPGLIVAGAGSGKTTVMAARVVWLVGTGQVAAAEVLGLTFTNKAAAELSHRIRTALRRLSPASGEHADDVAVATYHAFAGALLREFGLLIGVEPSAELMSPVRQRQLGMQVVAAADIDPRHLGKQPGDVVTAVLALDSLLADSDVPAAALAEFDDDLLGALASRAPQQRTGEKMAATAAARRELTRLVVAYRSAKRERELVDFADVVRLGSALARRQQPVGEALRLRHRSVLLDEYQDTSVAQRAMLQELFGGGHPVTAVGDPCQAIYGWRGASPANMDCFPEHFRRADGTPAGRFTLATNRRSGAAVLHVANRISAELRAAHQGVVELRPDDRTGSGAVIAGLLPTIDEELAWLVARLRTCGHRWCDVAVLTRTNDGAGEVVGALRDAGIPVQVHGKQALLALPEVRWVVWALRLIADPTANDALIGLLMGPAWRIGQRDMALLARRARDLAGAADVAEGLPPGDDLAAALHTDPLAFPCLLDALHDLGEPRRYPYSAAARARFGVAAGLFHGWQQRAGTAVADLIREIAVASGLTAELLLGAAGGAPGGAADETGLIALTDLARRFDDIGGGRGLTDFLGWLAIADTIPDGPEAPARPDADAVTVMTVHAAKGLEFPVVAVPAMVQGTFPSDRGRGQWPTTMTAIPPVLRQEPASDAVTGFPRDPAFPRASELTEFAAAARDAERLEEVRLAYVAVTRAKHTLILSGHRWGRTQRAPRVPSAFLQAAAAAAGTKAVELDVWALPPDEGTENPMLTPASATADRAPAPERAQQAALAAAVRAQSDQSEQPEPGPLEAAGLDAWDRDLARLRTEFALREAPTTVSAPPDLSVSQWLAMARDPAAFGRQLLRPVPWPDTRGAVIGDEFHAWVAAREDQLALWEDDLLDPGAMPASEQVALREAFAASPFGAMTPLAVEHEVAVRVADRVVRGRIDAVYAIDGEHWIVDWKTGAAGTADPLQLALYRIAWAAERGIDPSRVVGCFVHVRQRRYDVYRGLPGADSLTPASHPGASPVEPTSSRAWEV
jgi:DNA helicase-2/ATP-dependent DNA helicase PcrA